MANKIEMEFKNGFKGISTKDNGVSLEVGSDQWKPYELLYTALASCMYSTFLDVIDKKKLEYDKVQITVEGEKIDDVPAFLKKCDIVFTVFGTNKEDKKNTDKFEKSLRLSEKYCSIYNTLAKIAHMNSKILFA